ncbi:hypothetical protein EMIT051CA3_20653 [Pseudomonas chlororaphis]
MLCSRCRAREAAIGNAVAAKPESAVDHEKRAACSALWRGVKSTLLAPTPFWHPAPPFF